MKPIRVDRMTRDERKRRAAEPATRAGDAEQQGNGARGGISPPRNSERRDDERTREDARGRYSTGDFFPFTSK
jgi:hypothetical protein